MALTTIAINEELQRQIDSMLPYPLRVWKNLAPLRQKVQKKSRSVQSLTIEGSKIWIIGYQ